MRPQVLILQRRLPEYRLPLFEQLRARLDAEGVRLLLVHGEATPREKTRRDEGTLPWAVPVQNRYARLGRIPVVHQALPRALSTRSDLVVLSHENGLLSNYPLLVHRMLGGSGRLAFWGHGPTPGHRFRQGLKRWSTRQVDWWFAYTSLSVERVTAAGFPSDRVTCLENAIDTRALQAWAASVSEEERQALRRELGIEGAHVAVSLGSLSPEKNLPFLVRAADLIRERVPDFHLVMVGSGPLLTWLRDSARTRSWLHVVGARHDREKALYCSVARVNLTPGLVGLGIVDSFALGVPLLTTPSELHGPEIAYLEDRRNGLMTAREPEAFAAAAASVLCDDALRAQLAAGCAQAAGRYTIERMASRFADGILAALGATPGRTARAAPPTATPSPTPQAGAPRIAVVWRSFLPYHEARLRHLHRACGARGVRLDAIEVASDDGSYRFPHGDLERHCCFPGTVYQQHSAAEVFRTVRSTLFDLEPDVVFAPATPFPEGMAAIAYRNASGARIVLMDDAWTRTDRRGPLVRFVKRLLHRSVDGAFIPGPFHEPHYRTLGFPAERVLHGMDAVDNAAFADSGDRARRDAPAVRQRLGLPPRYLLFVGRFLARKGLGTLLEAYASYRASAAAPLPLLLAGGTSADLRGGALPPGVSALGRRFGQELCELYALADALVVPSHSDPWGLVVNEGMAAGVPVIVSLGCGASSLVQDGVNGWTFAPGDADALARALRSCAELPDEPRAALVGAARETISAWGLDRFAGSVLRALEIPRAVPATGAAALAARLWRGWVRVY